MNCMHWGLPGMVLHILQVEALCRIVYQDVLQQVHCLRGHRRGMRRQLILHLSADEALLD